MEHGKPDSSPSPGRLGMAGDPQRKLLVERVEEGGKSEGPVVMIGIRIRDLSGRESVQTSTRCSSLREAATILVVLM